MLISVYDAKPDMSLDYRLPATNRELVKRNIIIYLILRKLFYNLVI